ncbi:hypothetical protein GOQ30_18095 [Flavobacterium sp. TP390]|uniref:MORN repeat variant n=1 Tax=Flavobacterium profundi TaxID=1774945 RepID=A0A6I4IW28_9FLAO|nr:hypothetical protein [Flavobacterium profundi]MVO11086.1 hypothetical protein [Flavobacterium profundi]
MKKICIILLLFVAKIYSQEILKKEEVYTENNLVYKVSNSELFTGKIQSFKHKNHLTFEIEFKNGELIKSIEYFNGKKIKIAEEIFYRKYGVKEKKIKYEYLIDYKWIEYYDENNQKVLEEEYKDGILVYRCPYLNNKKNGIVYLIEKNGQKKECKFENGKLIKE